MRLAIKPAWTGLACLCAVMGMAAQAPPLRLVARDAMPATVTGRFDHLTADVAGNRLFLAAESAHQVLIFNLRSGQYERAIDGIQIPHAIFVRPDLNRIYVTDGGAGLKIYDGASYALLKSVPLKVDADSIGYDAAGHTLYIDNGGGDAGETFSMFTAVNTDSGEKTAEMKIDGDTLEAMALARTSPLIYINNRAKNQIAVVNRETHDIVASWPVTLAKGNVALALDEAGHRLFAGCRSGAIVVFDTRTGKELQALPIPPGVDDLIYDASGHRLYAATGAGTGAIAVYRQRTPDRYQRLGDVPSAPGGKNEVLAAQLRRLYVTIPPHQGQAGAVYVYQVE